MTVRTVTHWHIIALLSLTCLLGGCHPKAPTASTPDQAAVSPEVTAPPSGPSPGTLAARARGLPDFSDLVAQFGPAVVNITVTEKTKSRGPILGMDPLREFFRRFGGMPEPENEAPERGQGSGFIISSDGYILTNAHVVNDASEVTVRLTDRREFHAKVIGVDGRSDVAVIKINGQNLPTVHIGDAAKVRPGEWVVAIGSPFGFENSVTAGIVSATARAMDGQYTPFIQTDVAVNPGNSGGPLFNMAGEVIGINSQIYSQTGGFMGISFAIPIDMAIDVKEQLVHNGKVERGKIGVLVQDVSQQIADSFGLDRPRGAVIAQLEPHGPAESAGLRPGDIILSVNGAVIERSGQLSVRISKLKPGSVAHLQVWRDRATVNIDVPVVVFKEITEKTAATNNESAKTAPLGLSVRPLTPNQQQQSGLRYGLVVEDVRGAALAAGVRPGDVVVGANGAKVATLADLQAILEKSKRSVALLINRDGETVFIPVQLGE